MSDQSKSQSRLVRAVYGTQTPVLEAEFETGLAEYLRAEYDRERLIDLYARFAAGGSDFDLRMRRAIWRAIARKCGQGVVIGTGVAFRHLETFEIGTAVFIGGQSCLEGRFDGRFVIGDHVWIGPQSYFDARDLVIGDDVGWGPGAKVLGSTHTGVPADIPIMQTDLEIEPVRIGAGADVGMNAVVLPGVTIGNGSIIGAGAVVTKDVPPFAIVAGVPARFLRWRDGHAP